MIESTKNTINTALDDLASHYEERINKLTAGINALNEVEEFLSMCGLTFPDIAQQLGYTLVKVSNEQTAPEVDDSADQIAESTEANQSNDETVTNSQPIKTADELEALTNAEIIEIITEIQPDFKAGSRATKADLIAEYQLLTEKSE